MILTITLNPSIDHTLFIDHFTVGDTNRIQRCETDAGGKGINLSRVAHKLGRSTLASGFIGGPAGAEVLHVLIREGLRHRFQETQGESRSNFSVESGHDGSTTTLNAKGPEISPEEWEGFLNVLQSIAPEASWVAMGGSIPPGVPASAYQTITERMHTLGKLVLVDADGEPAKLALQAKPDMIKPNLKEAERLVGRALPGLDEQVQAAKELREKISDQGIAIITLGKEGAVLATPDQVFAGESPVVEVRSTVGSGDSFLAGLLSKRELGWAEALKWGLAAGAATAMSDGARIGTREDTEALLSEARVREIS